MKTTYNKTTLDSGLRIVSESLQYTHTVSIGFWICTGSRHDPDGQSGISHLLEHMLFKGTHTRSAFDIAISLESLGGYLNAFTEREFICLHATVLDEHLESAVEVLCDLIQNPRMNQSDFELEKNVIFEEIHALQDMPEDWIYDVWNEYLFKNNSLSRSILGTKEQLANLKIENLVSHFESCFGSENIIIAGSGNLKHKDLLNTVQKHYKRRAQERPRDYSATISITPFEKKIPLPISQCHIITGAHAFPYTDKKKFPLLLLNTYLSGGMSSLLFQELREKMGLAYSVHAFAHFFKDIGQYGIYIGTSPDTRQKAMETLESLLQTMCDNGLDNFLLKRLQNQIIGNIWISIEETFSRMARMSKMEFFLKKYVKIESTIEKINAVRTDEIQLVARELFIENPRVTIAFEPNS